MVPCAVPKLQFGSEAGVAVVLNEVALRALMGGKKNVEVEAQGRQIESRGARSGWDELFWALDNGEKKIVRKSETSII
jgi:hypothetical protein